MNRSKWKGYYVNPEYKKINTKETQISKLPIAPRNSEIISKFVNLIFKVYNGKKYKKITITNDMIGHKFGEFVFTRAKFSFKKKKRKKK